MRVRLLDLFSSQLRSWGSDLSPEDAGRTDGGKGYPTADDSVSEFEQQVRERFEASVEQIKRVHADEEANWAAQYQDLSARFSTTRDSYNRKRAALGERDVDTPFSHPLALGASVVLVIVSSVLDSYGFLHAGWEFWLAALFGLIMAFLVGSGSYLSGLIFRQAKGRFGFSIGSGILIGSILATVFVFCAFDHSDLGLAMRLALVSLQIVALLGICALAFYSHDPDPAYPPLAKKYEKLLVDISRVKSTRDGAQKGYLKDATALRDRAQELIRIYRHHNTRARNDLATPPFFDCDPELRVIIQTEFSLHGSNEH